MKTILLEKGDFLKDNKESLIERIKNAGQEVIDRAEELGSIDMITDLDIHLHFDMSFERNDTIEWSAEVLNKTSYKKRIEKEK